MSTKTRSVSDPNAKGSKNFLWAILAIVAIAVIVIGFVVWQSRDQRIEALADRGVTDLPISVDYSDNTVTLTSDQPNADAGNVDLYEDFSCPHCADLAVATDDQMLQEISNGDLVVNVHPMNFMDRGTNGHSTNTLAAVLALASHGDSGAYWSLRNLAFTDQQQIYNQWDDNDFADAAEAFGASNEAVRAIRDGEFHDEANQVGQANAQKLEAEAGEVSTPRVFLDGQEMNLPDMTQWVTEATK